MGRRPRRPHGRTARDGMADLPEDWKPRVHSLADIAELVARLPMEPGVYLMRDRKGRVVYVGKARNLRIRVRQYFSGQDSRHFVPRLGKVLGDIETMVTSNDKEALLLENHLIKGHAPRFNVKLRDDKQYLVLRLDSSKSWPRLEVVRNIAHDKAHYFGPYHSAGSARHTLRVVNRYFKLRTCSDYALNHRKRACLQYQIDRCPAPCVYDVDPDAYAGQVRDVRLFLGGRHSELLEGLNARMKESATALEFETAARIRDQITAIQTTLQSQRVVGTGEFDQDVIGMYREGGQVEFAVLYVRAGKLMGSRTYSQKGMELPDAEVLHGFLGALYGEASLLPDEILLPFALAEDDAAPLHEWLQEKRGSPLKLSVPERGSRKKLVDLAKRNSSSSFVTRRDRKEDSDTLLETLHKRFSLSRKPRRIECYDISHIQGSDAVGSMVVFKDGQADKSSYRSFKIKGLHGQGLAQGHRQNDDFASMQEVLTRRLRRALDAGDSANEDWALPDLVVIDGGKGQLSRVVAVMQDLGVPLGAEGMDVIALAKERLDVVRPGAAGLRTLRNFRQRGQSSPNSSPGQSLGDYVVSKAASSIAKEPAPADNNRQASQPDKPERVFLPGSKDPIRLRPGSTELYLMTRIRDEAHRFAITHHRKRRAKRQIKSILDEVPGVGKSAKRALLTHFGKIAAIRTATVEELCEVRGIGPGLAARIHEVLGSG